MDVSHFKVIDPVFDVGFKLIFGREGVSEPLLINLLNNIFYGDPDFGNITSLTFTNTEHPNEWVDGKGVRYDIKCVTANGHQFIVEMQKSDQKHFLERCAYYVSRCTAEQGYRGKNEENESWDFSLLPVVGVFLCNFHVVGLRRKALTTARLRDDDSGEEIGNFQRYAFIQLPCFLKEEKDCNTVLDQWIYNIRHMGDRQNVAFTTDNDIFKYLESVSNVAALTPKERNFYEDCLMRARDYNAGLKTAMEKGLAQGLAQGLEKGLAQGLAQGLEQGRLEGERRNLLRNVRRMREKGIKDEAIADLLDEPISVISALK